MKKSKLGADVRKFKTNRNYKIVFESTPYGNNWTYDLYIKSFNGNHIIKKEDEFALDFIGKYYD